jgi:NTE family protein
MKSKAPKKNPRSTPHKRRIVLVLQGGGALGAYQAGVFQAMHEHELAPDWVVGTSIGAINAAIIAGNKRPNRLARLKEFWDRISHRDSADLEHVVDQMRRMNAALVTSDAMLRGVPGFFAPRMFSPFPFGMAVDPEAASFYDTSALGNTLHELVDFDYLNEADEIRLTVNAVKVTSGELVQFDSLTQDIGVEHVMASGALPPGFPAVRVNGELYWDGGLYSNTPLETVLDDQPVVETLCFMVDLWNADGPEPTTLEEVQTRQKDVMFASRSKRHIDDYLRTHQLQSMVRELVDQLPPARQAAMKARLPQPLKRAGTMHIVRLPYGGQDWHMSAKDINFSKGSIEWRWEQGYRDAVRGIQQAGWLAEVDDGVGVVLHELQPEENLAEP